MVRVPTHREPTHPGEMLLEEFLKPMSVSQRDLAEAIHVPYQRVNELVNRKRGVTPSTALRLSQFFGTSAAFWLNLQLRWDLYHASIAEAAELKRIKRLQTTGATATANH
jgi:antitoxin HigA-1